MKKKWEKCINGLDELNQRREKARWWGENSVIIGILHGEEKEWSWKSEVGENENLCNPSSWALFGRTLFWSNAGVQEWSCHKNDTEWQRLPRPGEYMLYISLLSLRLRLHTTRCALLIHSLFMASISHTGNSLEIYKCAEPKPLNGHWR